MQALNFYVIIEKIKESPRKVGGLELTDNQDKEVRYLKGKVISVGDRVPDVIKPGYIVRYDRHAGHGLPGEDDNIYFVLKVDDLVAICDEN